MVDTVISRPGGGPITRWWRESEPAQRAEAIHSAYEWLWDQDSERRQRYLRMSSLYAGQLLDDIGQTAHMSAAVRQLEGAPPTSNLTKSVVDTAQAKVAVARPRVAVLTERGGSNLARKARGLDQFLWGLFYHLGAAGKRQLQLRDAAIWGDGLLRVVETVQGEQGHIDLERVYPWELLVDPLEALYGAPRSMIHFRNIDREVLAERFPEHAESIRDASLTPPAPTDAGQSRDVLADQVIVCEAWRLPSHEGAEDGHHAIATRHVLLTDPEASWESMRFPFSKLPWSKPQTGFWGNGIVEQIEGLQIEHNEMSLKVSDMLYHLAVPWILYEESSKIEPGHIDNDTRGCMIRYRGTPPQVVTHQAVNPDIYAQQDRVGQRAFELPGVSTLDATGRKPSGLSSGAALREFEDITTGRLGIVAQQYEEGAVELGRLLIDSAKRLDAAGGAIVVASEVRKRRRTFLERIAWKDVDMARDVYQLKVFPASALPSHPAGKLSRIEEMIGAGLMDRDMAMALLDYPDLDAAVSLETAPRELILDIIDRILDDNEYTPPEPNMPLELGLRLVGLAYNRAKLDGADESALSLLRQWELQAEQLLQRAAARLAARQAQAQAAAQAQAVAPGIAGDIAAGQAPGNGVSLPGGQS